MGREFKSFPTAVKAIEGRTVTGITAVTGNIDDHMDRIHRGAFKKTIKERSGRVRHLWQHDYENPPVAIVRGLREVGKEDLPEGLVKAGADGGLEVTREYLKTARADEVFEAVSAGAVNEMSIGFETVKFDFEELKNDDGTPRGMLRNVREVRLWDTSDVNWGANPLTVTIKAAIPFHDSGVAAESESWSAPSLGGFTSEDWEDLSDSEKGRIAMHYAWTANMPPETFGDLKLPHHKAAKTGTGPAVWRGVAAAMGRLLQSGTQVPDGDRRAVYNHLARHYAQFEKEPPDFKWFILVDAIGDVLTIEDLSLLNAKMLGDLKRIYDAIEQTIKAEPQTDSVLTKRVLQRLNILEHEAQVLTGQRSYHIPQR